MTLAAMHWMAKRHIWDGVKGGRQMTKSNHSSREQNRFFHYFKSHVWEYEHIGFSSYLHNQLVLAPATSDLCSHFNALNLTIIWTKFCLVFTNKTVLKMFHSTNRTFKTNTLLSHNIIMSRIYLIMWAWVGQFREISENTKYFKLLA